MSFGIYHDTLKSGSDLSLSFDQIEPTQISAVTRKQPTALTSGCVSKEVQVIAWQPSKLSVTCSSEASKFSMSWKHMDQQPGTIQHWIVMLASLP